MASLESTLKRHRDDQHQESKKHKSYTHHILSILDLDHDDIPDLSSLISTLRQQLSGQFPTDPDENSTGIVPNSDNSPVSGQFPTNPDENSTGIASISENSPVSGPIPTGSYENSTGIASNSEGSLSESPFPGPIQAGSYENSTGFASNSSVSLSESSVSDLSGQFPTEPEDNSTGIASNSEDSVSESSVSGPVPTGIADDSVSESSVMRHLLEASDDELGIPTFDLSEVGAEAGDGFGELDGLWEFGDESEDCFGLFEPELLM